MLVKTGKKSFKAEKISGIRTYWGLRFQKPRPVLLSTKGKKTDIDMIFCFCPMDIFWISGGRVMKKAEAKPFRIYLGIKADYVLETPKGFTELNEGDRVEIKQT